MRATIRRAAIRRAAITREEAVAALEDVHDAHVPASLRAMGMLSDVRVDGGHVRAELCLPCMACPAASYLASQVRERLLALDGVTSAEAAIAWHAQWDRRSVDGHARSLMRTHGIQI